MTLSLLALDSSMPACSVALYRDQEVKQLFKQERDGASYMLPMVKQLLDEANINLSQLSAIGYSRGPGYFTGLRVCCAIVQGLAYGAKLPVIGVSTLEVLAYHLLATEQVQSGERIIPAIDAKGGKIYWAIYEVMPDYTLKTCVKECATAPEALLLEDLIVSEKIWALGDGWALKTTSELHKHVAKMLPDALPQARDVALLAKKRYNNKASLETPDSAVPIYLHTKELYQRYSS